MVMEEQVVQTLRRIFDPEIPVSIYDLGLIYGVEISPEEKVAIRMTLTAPNCPAAQSLPAEVVRRVREIPGVADATVEIVFDPPWHPGRMSEAAQLELGMGPITL